MEQWEALIEACPSPPDIKNFNKLIQSAGIVLLKEDLAQFEIEWILQTILFKPVHLISTVTNKRNDDAWSKAIGDAFKLLTEIIKKHPESLQPYYDDIITLSLLPYDTVTRKQALVCASEIARVSSAGARDAHRHISSLEEMSTCRAALVTLVGTICEYHPEVVSEDFIKIWRIFLNLLDSNKNTDTVTSALLQGILSLFKHFGSDLPMSELNSFYYRLTKDFIDVPTCENVVLSILTEHASLFRERISRDHTIRSFVWNSLQENIKARPALESVYGAVCSVVDCQTLQKIITSEILQHTQSSLTRVKYTALRVLSYIRANVPGVIIEMPGADVQVLICELSTQVISYETAEAIAWCIESNLPECDLLLHTAVAFYTNIPAVKRKDIVVYGILKAPDDLRTSAITFLISESTSSEDSLAQRLPLWRDLFDSRGGTDAVVADNARRIVDDVITYVVFVLRGFLDERAEKIPDKLSNLLNLTHHVLTLQPPEEYPAEYFETLLSLITELIEIYGADAASIAVARVIGGAEICKMVPIDRCKDEALLCEACLAIIHSDSGDVNNLLTALQIMFSRNDVEPTTLCKALKRFESLLSTNKSVIDNKCVLETIDQIQKLRDRKDMKGKDARVLHRDVFIFLGKHGTRTALNNNQNTAENTLIIKLKDTLTLNLPNPHEGSHYKINLQEILQLALISENVDVLKTLLSIICAHLTARQDPYLRLALSRVVACLARCHSRGENIEPAIIESAIYFCDDIACVTQLITYISEERSPGVRKMLSDALEVLLKGPDKDALLNTVVERATVMCLADEPTMKRAGLDITQTLVTALKDNNQLSKSLLPNILVTVSRTFEIDSEITFWLATEVFFEKFELFDENSLKNLVKDLLLVLLNVELENEGEITWKAYKKTVKFNIEFIKKIFNNKKTEGNTKITPIFFECYEKQDGVDSQKSLYVLAQMRRGFDIDLETSREVLCYKECEILNKFLASEFKYSMSNCMRLEAILNFMEVYIDVLLELKYKETLDYTAKALVNLSPVHGKYLQKPLETFMTAYRDKLKKIPQILKVALQEWCQNLPLDQITESMSKNHFDNNHAVTLHSLKIMLDIYGLTDLSHLTCVSEYARKWPRILLRIFSNEFSRDVLKMKLLHVTDAMTVAVKFMTVTDVKKILLEGIDIRNVANERIGMKFCRFFIHVFCEVLVKKPYLLLDDDMKSCCMVVNDLVKYVLNKKMCDQVYEDVLELVDKLWPIYETQTTFNQKQSLLADISNLPTKLGRESNPMQWVVDFIASDATVGEKARLIGVLPGGGEYSQCYRTFACLLPTRLSEMRGSAQASFRAILDALAVNGDVQLFEIVMALAGGDDTKGWWDESINTCMSALSHSGNTELCKAAFTRCFDGLSLGVCERILAPLLRYSSPQSCESFFSTVIQELLQKLYSFKPMSSTHYKYQESVANVTRAMVLLRVAFEKVPPISIESPSSLLYREVKTDQSWYLVRKVCMACATLQRVTYPGNADDQFRERVRLFHCANYNCLTTAICLRKPDAKPYKAVFGPKAWQNLINPDTKYLLRLRNNWSARTKRQPTSIMTESEHLNPQNLSSATMTSRTKLFLRTLSDNPIRYDLLFTEESEDTMAPLELQLDDNELNNHECSPTLTSLFCHVASLSHTEWRDATVDTLKASGVETQVKCLIAQTIVNCKEELRAHASAFRPALLAFVADSVSIENGKRLLNRLHVDVIETLLQWGDTSPEPSTHLDAVLFALINTCLENRQRTNIFGSLAAILDKFLEVYKGVVKIEWQVFQPYFTDRTKYALKTLQILTKITKSKIYIPELLPMLISKLENNEYFGQLPKLAELFGLAMDCRMDYSILARFGKVLERSRRNNGGDYVKMLYYAQQGCKNICDEHNFKTTIDLLPKIMGAEKPKCLQILSSYIQTHPSEECVQEMFGIVDISELLSQDDPGEAVGLLRGGFTGLDEGVKRRVIMQLGGLCGHALEKTRRAAFEVMLKVFEDLYDVTHQESSSKRPKANIKTPIIDSIQDKDIFVKTVISCMGCGLTDRSESIRSMVLEGIKKFLYGDCMGVRFTECFILTIYYPITHKNINNKNIDASVCLSALLELLLTGLIDDPRFQNVRLRDDPLPMSRQPSLAPSRLLTLSRTYQGTFRGRSLTTRRTNIHIQNAAVSDIDVQITLKSVLETFLQFSKTTPQAATALCLQILKSLDKNPNFELGTTLAKQLVTSLSASLNELTPFIVELSRLFVDDCSKVEGFKTAIDNLRTHTKGTEGEFHTKLLYEEYYLSTGDRDMFVLGFYEDVDDVKMEEELAFCIEDLISVFGKLSNWDDLTIQQRRNIRNEGLPPLWTDSDTFKACLDGYTGEGWFAKMVSAYRNEKDEFMKWLKEADRWPRRPFHMSALTEALEWHQDKNTFPCDIPPSDCLAEWSARLMIRAAHLNSISSDSEEASADSMLSRSHELIWCERANEMELPSAVMDCVKRNMEDLHRSETLPWLRQKALALRTMGLQHRDGGILQRALVAAETYTPNTEFRKHSSPECIIAMYKLILQLNQDLESLSTEKINKIIEEVHEQSTNTDAQSNVQSLIPIYEIAMSFYEDQWDISADDTATSDVISNMAVLLQHIVESNTPHGELFLDLILNRFDDCPVLREDTAKIFLDTIQLIFHELDECSTNELRRHTTLFPSHLLTRYRFMSEGDEEITLNKFKRCFELVNDAEYLLLQYCELLVKAVLENDMNASKWMEIFDRMRQKIFENPYSGTDYQLLIKYKDKLYGIRNFETDPSFKTKALSIVEDVTRELKLRKRQDVLRLTQMCPTLGTSLVSVPCVGKLLGLPSGVHVVKFDEQVPIFTDSIRRPAVLRYLLSDGTTRRHIHKSGESLKADAAVQRIQSVVDGVFGGDVVGYKVTPLSDDCGLIEYLEDYDRIRNVIAKKMRIDKNCDLDKILDTVSRPLDDELILLPSVMSLHRQLCEKAPAKSLRSSIQLHSASTQDFIWKKHRFLETLASMTILNWVLGVGDRHLQNIMYSIQNGAVCGVDFASCLQFGACGGELPPARLTNNFLAVCDVSVLESRLQRLLSTLRNSHRIFLPVIRISFKWMGMEFDDKFKHITSILGGKSLSYQITRHSIQNSDQYKYKSKYIQLLESIFSEFEEKEVYSVEEQISCLLRQCTEPQILSVTRSGWEPWV